MSGLPRTEYTACGWCITLLCSSCLPEFEFSGRVWVCGCKRCGSERTQVIDKAESAGVE